MKSSLYIKDKRKLIEALFEEAFGETLDNIVKNWEEYTSLSLSPAKEGKLQFAYTLAQELKSELDYYPYLAFLVACHHDFPWDRYEIEVCEDLLPYCKDEKLRFHAGSSIKSINKRLSDECGTGFFEEAKPFVENLHLLYDALGEDVSLHDAVVSKVDYDRENETAMVVIDTMYRWENHNPSLITIRFDEILDIKWDSDISCDYASEFVCYHQDIPYEHIGFVLKSTEFRVECRHMTIISVEEYEC